MKYVCSICGYIYDEVTEGTAFADLPSNWVCPLCHAAKSAFAPERSELSEPVDFEPLPADPDLKELSPAELSAVFSNLARGCEKQYQREAQEKFQELAVYFSKVAPMPETASVEQLADLIRKDLDSDYARLRSIAAKHGDRGAQRVCVWGEKVTRSVDALLTRYAEEGDTLLEHTSIWLCTVCGFLYVGDEPPALCPVCKVPAWKFEKVGGQAS